MKKLHQLHQDEQEIATLLQQGITPLSDAIHQAVRQWDATLHGMRVRGAVPVRVLTSAGAQTVSYGPGEWSGFLLTETTGTTAATVTFHNGRDALADLLAIVKLAAGESTREVWTPRGVTFSDGLFITVTGAVDGSVLLAAGS